MDSVSIATPLSLSRQLYVGVMSLLYSLLLALCASVPTFVAIGFIDHPINYIQFTLIVLVITPHLYKAADNPNLSVSKQWLPYYGLTLWGFLATLLLLPTAPPLQWDEKAIVSNQDALIDTVIAERYTHVWTYDLSSEIRQSAHDLRPSCAHQLLTDSSFLFATQQTNQQVEDCTQQIAQRVAEKFGDAEITVDQYQALNDWSAKCPYMAHHWSRSIGSVVTQNMFANWTKQLNNWSLIAARNNQPCAFHK